ncbi:S41 family peptidase [Chitinophaga sp. RAB17]|uniref:S41 family peptidase n=1 Tax=Chitinophaga sp. RAB17 TaxID=3233049 RepID=UPI003F91117D
MFIERLVCLGCCCIALSVNAQQGLPTREVAKAVDSAAALLRRHYVFADKGEKIARHLEEKYKAGAFRQVADWKTFDSLGTAILRNFSQDGHLYLRYNPDKVTKIRSQQQPQGIDDFFHSQKTREQNYGFREVKILNGNTGYIKMDQINISDESLPVLQAAMTLVSRTNALIIDLRDNGGGGSEIKPVLESYFLPAALPLLEFYSRTGNKEIDSSIVLPAGQPYQGALYILLNKGTASAAEAFAYVLQAQHRAKIVGQPSAGAANHNEYFVVNNEVFISISESAPALPGTQQNWERTGVQPDIVTAPGEELNEVLKIVEKKK